nr:class I SAM-dependent methyltransferase [Lysobacter sp. CAU 1642]
MHRNDPDDPGYRRFVAPLVEALRTRLAPASEGLDFGCGPGSAPAAMLREAGHRVTGYDPQFAPGADALRRQYDFVVVCEVAEHLQAPAAVFAMLRGRLRRGGVIGVKTGFVPEPERFVRWHYLRDPTHVVLFSPTSIEWLAAQLELECMLYPEHGVALLAAPA